MKLELLGTLHADLNPALPVGAGPLGLRIIGEVKGGWFEGPRLRATIVGPGADWLLVSADGFGRIDVRIALRTEDDAVIYASYGGLLEMNEGVVGAMGQGGTTEFGAQYFFTTPRFETGDPRYDWLNRIVAVAEGRVAENAVEYRVFALVNG